MRLDRLPLTYDECRARFRRAADDARLEVASAAIDARGPEGQQLTVDAVRAGPAGAPRMLTVLSGVHGVEGFIGSALQCDLLGRLDLAPETGVLLVHGVNPWGMAWGRRQNEHNVDLNRNWRRDDGVPFENDAYDELHALACPDSAELPSIDELLATATELVAERGFEWVRDGITLGQYRHADGLHYGGARTEPSLRVLERLITTHVAGTTEHLVVDLHTGHGPSGALTLLSDQPPDSAQHAVLSGLAADSVEATTGNPEATTGRKRGQIGNGIGTLLGEARHYATSAEFGTVDDEAQLIATFHEQWVHRRGDLSRRAHAAARRAYRDCFTPDDRRWEATATAKGAALLDSAVEWLGTGRGGRDRATMEP